MLVSNASFKFSLANCVHTYGPDGSYPGKGFKSACLKTSFFSNSRPLGSGDLIKLPEELR